MVVGIAGHAVNGDAERVRDLYAAAAASWVEAGQMRHGVFVPASDEALLDAWFRLSFGASGALAIRETAPEEPFDAAAEIRRGTPADLAAAAPVPSAAEAAPALLKRADGAQEVDLAEGGPQDVGEVKLAVGVLP